MEGATTFLTIHFVAASSSLHANLKRCQRPQAAIVTGWERSCRAVSFLRSKRLEAESVILEDFSHWPNSGETWDVIAGFHVLEHLVEPVKVVASLLSRLVPEGLLIFQVPRINSWQARIFGRW